MCYDDSIMGTFKPVHCKYLSDEKCNGCHTFPRLSYTLVHLALLAHLLCAAIWGEVWRALTMIEGECTAARDPLKRAQRLTAEEGCSGNYKRYKCLWYINISERFMVLVNKILAFFLLPAGPGMEDLMLPGCGWSDTELMKTLHLRNLRRTKCINPSSML